MKVLQIHGGDSGWGGGQIAMDRLHCSLRKAGVDSKILCANNTRDDSIAIPRWPRLEWRLQRFTSRLGLNDIHCMGTFSIKKLGDYSDADILHIHCIHDGFFNYLALPALTRNKPGVFTLHDMWPFTGHCAYSYDCDRWKTGCGKCPYPDTPPAVRRDATWVEWKLKDWVYSRSSFTIVTPSKWMTDMAKQSMLSRFTIHYIPNGVDTEAYQPIDREQCRSVLRIPPGRRVLMFAAASLNERDPGTGNRKGGDLLVKALQNLPESLRSETVLLLFGRNGESIARAVGLPTVDLGYLGGDHAKAIAYSASDLFICPTRADNMPLVLLESMACGTPIVSFRVGGIPDLVRPGITGYLAEPESAKDLCDGIVQLLEDEPLRKRMREKCRAIALKEYPLELHVERHVELYRQLVQDNG